MIFVDTSALYAVLDYDDANHPLARSTWTDILRSSSGLLTHNYVLVETCALAQNRLGMRALRAIEESIMPLLEVHWISGAQHRAAVHMALAADRRKLSVVDCASFLVMRERHISRAFAFDSHFNEQGFQLAPGA
jgi:predicted nucleic acid-binding protein